MLRRSQRPEPCDARIQVHDHDLVHEEEASTRSARMAPTTSPTVPLLVASGEDDADCRAVLGGHRVRSCQVDQKCVELAYQRAASFSTRSLLVVAAPMRGDVCAVRGRVHAHMQLSRRLGGLLFTELFPGRGAPC